jgi:hypothetical protein
MAALRNGYEDNFVWGVEKVGTNHHRLMQKRGQTVDGEDFAVIGKNFSINKKKSSTMA